MPDRALADIVALSASALEHWTRCPRELYLGDVLGLPPSDPGASPDFGLLVHRTLDLVHRTGSCLDAGHVTEILAGHGLDDDGALADVVRRHARRCPSDGARGHHEVELARFHRRPPPMFMATGRLDAVWEHGGILEVRDYKTGRPFVEQVRDDVRARLQAWLAAPVARRRGLQLRIRYEHLAVEVDEDPEPFDPDADDLDAIGEELRQVAAAIRAAAAAGAWAGHGDREVCSRCRYRSVCADSTARGEPHWGPPAAHPS